MEHPDPWEEFPEVWPTKGAFFTWLRGCLRRSVWEKYPPKIIFKKSMMVPPPADYTGKSRSGALCALTGEWTGNSKLQVDHIIGNASCRDWSDVLPFIRHLCTHKENMQLVDKEAHKIKSYAERMGISFEEAVLEKKVIAFKKLKTDEQKKVLTELGIDVTMLSTVSKRVEAYRDHVNHRGEK